ncbi:rad25/xp-B DNA repair helicase, putative [Entamoeba dispar SAW760]|uniref:DNA 3'-5' helicase n=1 Tax=Entamoeba dispar (strain ATCC PRA-260 / SAW760) TaxID=370354 RepID=B0EPC3_ENTDS|nr:rad25/xp-B DNA repair helicase, putative [Entamoeba dispar SAW760]EDR23627.1 rad25/xp-B DNA repair helicase, putative [Entamoeba dispar SAW760]|eukprot:EDR23627.1 rad25/xp-B DNA repair helicase, putative [Entamoeba dispar SAW760]
MHKKRDTSDDSSEDSLEDMKESTDYDMRLKPNHPELPMWVSSNLRIVVETSNDMFKEVSDYLSRVAQVKSRMEHMHEYQLTPTSIMTAFSFGSTPEAMISTLEKYSKNYLPDNVKSQIRQAGEKKQNFRLVLINGKYYLQAESQEQMKKVMEENFKQFYEGSAREVKESDELYRELDLDHHVFIIEVKQTSVFKLKKKCKKKKVRVYEEYHFLRDKQKELPIQLRKDCLRPHQERALQQIFDNEMARSGIVVLPCGAGKTLTAIAACSKIKRSTIVLTHTTQSVFQWKEEFLKWSTIKPDAIKLCVSSKKEQLGDDACVLITSYSMLSHTGEREYAGQRIIDDLLKREWGFIIFDEVHGSTTDNIEKFVCKIKAQCKLGLTATLIREDDRIRDLEFMIGPMLYEASWQELAKQGYIANAKCFEVICPMTKTYYSAYVEADDSKLKQCLAQLNPNKIDACKYLLEQHKAHGDKIIIFCNELKPAGFYKEKLKLQKCYMDGNTSEEHRRNLLDQFRRDEISVIFCSKIGDVGLDLPDASVAIQLSSSSGSRRQEAQRLGRILRAKDGTNSAYFYTLTSKDTREMYFSQRRQRVMRQNGYTFKVIDSAVIKPLRKEDPAKEGKDINYVTEMLKKKDEKGVKEIVKKTKKKTFLN